MSTMEVRSVSAADAILEAVEQLSDDDFYFFMQRVLRLNADRKISDISENETELVAKINGGPTRDVWEEFRFLCKKFRSRTLSEEEKITFKELNNQVEAWNVERLSYLIQLSRVQQKPLQQIMNDLGIETPSYE